MLSFKVIRSKGASFIWRLALNFKHGSIKLHVFLQDDKDELHSHPWDFTSFLIIPYLEMHSYSQPPCYWKYIRHRPFSTVRRTRSEYHKVRLYRFLGIPIPAVTVGWYGRKKELCSFCKELGYCKTTGKPIGQ